MNKWLFIFLEFSKGLLLFIISAVVIYATLHFFDFTESKGSIIITSVIVGMLAGPIFSFLYKVRRLYLLGIDFNLPVNQSGNLELNMEVMLPKEEIINTFKERKTVYEIIEHKELETGDEFYIQHARRKKDNIKLTIAPMNTFDNLVTISTSRKKSKYAIFTMASRYWMSFTEHFFQFSKLIKGREVEFIKSGEAKQKLAIL